MTERPLAADPFTTTNGYTLPRPPAPPRRRERGPVWNVVLFVLTCFTTLLAGTIFSGSPTFDAYRASREPLTWMLSGVPFAATLLGILVVHEFGHYFTARARGAAVSLPFFIPAPPAIFMAGTLGAIIRMRSSVRDRNALFDIPAAGARPAPRVRRVGAHARARVAALRHAAGRHGRVHAPDGRRRVVRVPRDGAEPVAGRPARRRPHRLRAVPAPSRKARPSHGRRADHARRGGRRRVVRRAAGVDVG